MPISTRPSPATSRYWGSPVNASLSPRSVGSECPVPVTRTFTTAAAFWRSFVGGHRQRDTDEIGDRGFRHERVELVRISR